MESLEHAGAARVAFCCPDDRGVKDAGASIAPVAGACCDEVPLCHLVPPCAAFQAVFLVGCPEPSDKGTRPAALVLAGWLPVHAADRLHLDVLANGAVPAVPRRGAAGADERGTGSALLLRQPRRFALCR